MKYLLIFTIISVLLTLGTASALRSPAGGNHFCPPPGIGWNYEPPPVGKPDTPVSDPPPEIQRDFFRASGFVICRGVCYDQQGNVLSEHSKIIDKKGGCHEKYIDARNEGEKLLEEAKEQCIAELSQECQDTMKFDVWSERQHFFTMSFPDLCKLI